MTTPIVILGSGYTGGHLARLLTTLARHFFATSREPEKNLSHLPVDRRVRFDLAQPDTWANIPTGADFIWCFPATPLPEVHAFATTLDAPPRRIIVLGSTSAYDIAHDSQDYPPPWIDETTPIDLTKPRVQGEEYLRTEHSAIVLRVAGIYGPGRNPLEWIKSGRVGPTRKYVNLIHVEDLAAICLAAINQGKPGDVYNVSDGQPRTWADICHVTRTGWGIAPNGMGKEDQSGKRISNHKLVQNLEPRFQHPDLYTVLQTLT